jgi:hypothetical protein
MGAADTNNYNYFWHRKLVYAWTLKILLPTSQVWLTHQLILL